MTWLRIEGDRAIVEVTGALMNYHRRGEGWSAGLEPNKVYEIEVGLERGEWTHANPTTPTGVIVPERLRAIALEAVQRHQSRIDAWEEERLADEQRQREQRLLAEEMTRRGEL